MRRMLIAGVAAAASIALVPMVNAPTAHAWTCNDLVQAALIPGCLSLPLTGPDSQQAFLNGIATSDPTQIRAGAVQDPPAPIPAYCSYAQQGACPH